MVTKAGLYTIENFNTEPGLGQGRYGPSIILDGEIVMTLLEKSEPRDETTPLFSMLKDRLQKSIPKYDRGLARLEFYGDSWLLTGMTLGANCACFSIDGHTRSDIGEQIYDSIRYSPHNIDSPDTAAVIVSTWLLWFNSIIASTEFELPYAM